MNVEGRFWIELDGRALAGRGRIELLEHIRDGGSISEAAKTMKMGYKAAWDTVEAINRASRQPVVLRTKGGRTGGGTRLTDYGLALIESFRSMEREHARFLEELRDRYGAALDAAQVPVTAPEAGEASQARPGLRDVP